MMRLLVALMFAARAAGEEAPSPTCQAEMDASCNADAPCVGTIRADGFILPLVARYDLGHPPIIGKSSKQWRCYSPSSLSPDKSHYAGGVAYCSRNSVLRSVLSLCEAGANIVHLNATAVWTAAEIHTCGYIRTPQLVATDGPVGKTLLFAQCRTAKKGRNVARGNGGLVGDDFLFSRMVVKESLDGGATWGAMRFVSKRDTGVGVATFDRVTKTLIFQYQTMPDPLDPYRNNTLWQTTSTDEGATWTPPRDISPQIAHCNNNPPKSEMMCGGAGSRIQTAGGRIVFSGHNKDDICVW